MSAESILCGLLTAVEELRQFRSMYEKDPTVKNLGYIRLAEMSVIQMAESLSNAKSCDISSPQQAHRLGD